MLAKNYRQMLNSFLLHIYDLQECCVWLEMLFLFTSIFAMAIFVIYGTAKQSGNKILQ